MLTLLMSDEFDAWLDRLSDQRAKARIAARLTSAASGHFGDVAPIGDGISEMRIHYGPGYRLYYTRRGAALYILLIGGDKTSQRRDIRRAKIMVTKLGEDT